MIRFGKTLFLLMGVLSTVGMAHADAPVIPGPPAGKSKTCRKVTAKRVSRQRAVKNNQAGEPVMVMELTMTQVEAGHQVNLEAVLLEMRKSVQKGFYQSGYQSACSRMHATTLSRLPALETTCTITQNGRHVLVANIGRCGGCR
jgi:hypothetical protein